MNEKEETKEQEIIDPPQVNNDVNIQERNEFMKDLEKIESNESGTTDFGNKSTQKKSSIALTDKQQNDKIKSKNNLYKTEENKEMKKEKEEKNPNQTEKKNEINQNNKNGIMNEEILANLSKGQNEKSIQENEESNYEEKSLAFQNMNKIISPEDKKENCIIKESSLTIKDGNHINNPQINEKEKPISYSDDKQNINNINNSRVSEDEKSMSISDEIHNNENNPQNHEGNDNNFNEEIDQMSLGENQNESNPNNLHNQGEDMLYNNSNNIIQNNNFTGINENAIDINNELDSTINNTNENNNNENIENNQIYNNLSNYFNWINDNDIISSGYCNVNSNRER